MNNIRSAVNYQLHILLCIFIYIMFVLLHVHEKNDFAKYLKI